MATVWKILVLVLVLVACGVPATTAGSVADRCAFGVAPTVIRIDHNAILERWDLADRPVLSGPVLPDDAAFAEYRRVIREAHADLKRPIADAPEPKDDDERELWQREAGNQDVAYSGRAGVIRPIDCIEALLFAHQNARFAELTQPTELVASILRKQIAGKSMLRVYFGASDVMFPPKPYYGFTEVKDDVAAGWEWMTMLHDHTVRKRGDRPALGVTCPSTSDVQLGRNLAQDGLRSARVTNGFYTIDIPASLFGLYTAHQ